MTLQSARYNEALERMHRPVYMKAHDKVLSAEEARGSITITVNPKELELLKLLVSGKIGEEHEIWYAVSHDEAIRVDDMAYELAESSLREDRLHRLMDKLYKG